MIDAPELWDTQQIADYFHVSRKYVQNHMIHAEGFPQPIRGPKSPKLFVAQEVVDYSLNRAA